MNPKKQTVAWANGSNIYEVNIRQYTYEGTFAAFAKHLPRLKEMGIEILWLMPITPISFERRLGQLGSYYACSSYTAINPEFGSIDDFKNLVNEVHALDMKIIIDWVANHTGCDHIWMKNKPGWYARDASGNFTERNGWSDVIDLDYENTEMREAMISAMQFWINDCDIDGFRCDMAHLVPLDFWKDARKQCETIKPLFWLAECDVPEYLEVFDVSYAWEWMHVSEKLVKGLASLQHIKDVLDKYAVDTNEGKKLFFTSNHDENSWNGTEYEKYGAGAKAFAVFCFTWPGIPLLYSGQELPNYKRLKFFDKDQIDWNDKPALHEFYKLLLHLRKNNNAFDNDASLIKLATGFEDKVFAYLLVKDDSRVLVLLNFSDHDRLHFSIEHEMLNGNFTNLFSGIEYELKSKSNFEMQGWEYMVYKNLSKV